MSPRRTLSLALASLALATPSLARTGPAPKSLSLDLRPLAQVQEIVMPYVDTDALRREDELAAARPGPTRFAWRFDVDYDTDRHGTWEYLADDSRIWRLLLHSPDARSLNFAFSHFVLPAGAQLHLRNPETGYTEGPFDSRDNSPHGEFWSPVVLGDLAVVELFVPAKAEFEPELALMKVNHGYRIFGASAPPEDEQGSCNIDVVCPEGDPWRQEIRSEGVYSISGWFMCSGQMMNMVSEEFRHYFLTANHCGISTGNDQSVVVYWNFESPSCGMLSGGSLADNQSGSTWRSGNSFSDFTLIELDDDPDPAWQVAYSGFDATGDVPSSCVAIHHPGTDEKAISFNDDALISESYLGNLPNNHSHWQVNDWEVGTTEPGSSGSGIWDPNHRLIGQLHGGYASCTSITPDWYGQFSESWDRGSSASSRIKDWLDPYNTGIRTVDTADPHPPTPTTALSAFGSRDYCDTVTNGVWEPGEQIYVGAQLLAVNGDVTNIQGQLTALSGGVTVLDGIASWPDIPQGTEAISESPHFLVELDQSVTCDAVLEFQLDTQFDQGTASTTFSQQVGRDGPPLGTFESIDVPKSIPDDYPGGATSSMNVAAGGTIDRVWVGLEIEHTWVGDLEVEVISPDGTTVTLLDRAGGTGCNDDDMRVVFSDASPLDLNNHCADTTPWYEGFGHPLEALSALSGESAAGTWSLRVIDHAGADTGSIVRWGVRIYDAEGRICEVCSG